MMEGDWVFWNTPKALKNEKTGEIVHVEFLTTSAKMLHEILRLEEKGCNDLSGFVKLLARIMRERFAMRARDVLCPCGDSREAEWLGGKTRPEGQNGPFGERSDHEPFL
jgi:hypothetical protein